MPIVKTDRFRPEVGELLGIVTIDSHTHSAKTHIDGPRQRRPVASWLNAFGIS
ncbi:uncharacterized protein METZ01_LOCUS13863 [marine metagenome]|uniref:Uncharacterized protein n=1 Tax=marine metagenome TaxID=408172 RepID=A0A381P3W0_9ZZZZ